MSEQMQVTLKLYHDQTHLTGEPEGELIWELFVNGQPFPHRHANILESRDINRIVRALVDLEEQLSE